MGLLQEDHPCCNYYICWISGLDIWKVVDKFIASKLPNESTELGVHSTQLNEFQRTQVVTPQCPYLNNSTSTKLCITYFIH